jgi:hypothetical protein
MVDTTVNMMLDDEGGSIFAFHDLDYHTSRHPSQPCGPQQRSCVLTLSRIHQIKNGLSRVLRTSLCVILGVAMAISVINTSNFKI